VKISGAGSIQEDGKCAILISTEFYLPEKKLKETKNYHIKKDKYIA